MRYFIRTIFSLILILVVGSALLPNQYQITKTIASQCQEEAFAQFVLDLANWHRWTPWATYQQSWQQIELANSNKIGAYLKWENGEDIGEMTVTALTPHSISYISSVGTHTSNGKLSTDSFSKNNQLTWAIEGGINTPILGSLFTQYHKYKMQDAIDLGLKNLNSLCKSSS